MNSERLIFRELKMTDAARLFEIYSDQEAMKYRQVKPHLSIDDSFEMIRRDAEVRANGSEFRFGIVEKETNQLIGSVMYQPIGNKAIIGYSIGKNHWGKGFATEIVAALIKYLKKQSFTLAEAWVMHENFASKRVLEKNNFNKISQTIYPSSQFYQKYL